MEKMSKLTEKKVFFNIKIYSHFFSLFVFMFFFIFIKSSYFLYFYNFLELLVSFIIYFLNYILFLNKVDSEVMSFIAMLMKDMMLTPIHSFYNVYYLTFPISYILFYSHIYFFSFNFLTLLLKMGKYMMCSKKMMSFLIIFFCMFIEVVLVSGGLLEFHFSEYPESKLQMVYNNPEVALNWVYVWVVKILMLFDKFLMLFIFLVIFFNLSVLFELCMNILYKLEKGKKIVEILNFFPKKIPYKKSIDMYLLLNMNNLFKFFHLFFFTGILFIISNNFAMFYYWAFVVPISYFFYFLMILTNMLGILSLESSSSFWYWIYQMTVAFPLLLMYGGFSGIYIMLFFLTYKFSLNFFSDFLKSFSNKILFILFLIFGFFGNILKFILDILEFNSVVDFFLLFYILPLVFILEMFYFLYYLGSYLFIKSIKFIMKMPSYFHTSVFSVFQFLSKQGSDSGILF